MSAVPAPLIRPTATEAMNAVRTAGGARRVVKPLAWNPNKHLLSRFTFGPWGSGEGPGNLDKWFDKQVTLGQTQGGYSALPALATLYPYLVLAPAQTRMKLKADGNEYSNAAQDQAVKATIALQCWSPAQLYETVVDFFSNRLNVGAYTDGVWVNRLSYDRDVIRRYAFGSYRDMLTAAMKHPAMLTYLNNDLSNWTAPNENLGRELLELHTVGLAAGYTQDDVVASANLLTGRSVDGKFNDYQWNNGYHSLGARTVLGFTHADDGVAKGEATGDAYIAYLATHPSTATSLARAMCVRFVSDTPSDELVQAVAQAYLANDTAIVPMLRTIVRSTEFWDSRGRKLRRPLENVVATVRALQLNPLDLDKAAGTLVNYAANTGQRPLSCFAPPGYADVQTAWLSSGALLRLWSFQNALLKGQWPDQFPKPTTDWLYGGTSPATTSAALAALAKTLLSATLTTDEQNALLEYLGESPGLALSRSHLSSGVLQDVAGMLLHTAHHHLR